jgi:hypothetical protein
VSFSDRDNPLFFKRDGGMALGQFFLGALILWVCVIFTLNGLGILTYTIAAWSFLGSFTALFFIAFAAETRAALIANSKTPGEIAQGIASSPPYPGMDQDERTDDD